MNLKILALFSLIIIGLVSCSPPSYPAPATETAAPAPRTTQMPTPTIPTTPTLTPENIFYTQDLPIWLGEFVHAYGGKVTVNSIEMDARQLEEAIKLRPDSFVQTKRVNESEYLFLIVNNVPIAMRAENGSWQEATMARLGEMNDVEFECSLRLDGRKYDEFRKVSEKALGKSPVVVWTTNLDVTRVFGDFSELDWQRVLDDWENIQQALSAGQVPLDYPYYWQWGVDGMDADVVRAFGGNPQYRSTQLYEGGLRPDGVRIEALKKFQSQTSQEDMLKIFEFVVRTRVIRFPEVDRWDVSDEVAAAYLGLIDNNESPVEVNFWGMATGLKPTELALKVAQWVKMDNLDAKTYINEPNIFDPGNPVASRQIDYFYNSFLPEIIEGNGEHYIDGVIGQNNWWIGEPQDWSIISERIDFLNANELEIGGSETMIVAGKVPINNCCGRRELVAIQYPKLAQAEMFATWLDLYLDKGIKTIGFGNIDDFYAWTQDVGLPDANPTLFDIEFRAKPAYYAIVQVLYEHLP